MKKLAKIGFKYPTVFIGGLADPAPILFTVFSCKGANSRGVALFRKILEGSAWAVGAFLHHFFPKDFSENLPGLVLG